MRRSPNKGKSDPSVLARVADQESEEEEDDEVQEEEEVKDDEMSDIEDFALTPALASRTTINFMSDGGFGTKLWKSGSAKLAVQIDCSPANLGTVLSAIEDRAMTFGWDKTILNIPDDAYDVDSRTKNLLTQYGQIDMEHIREHVDTYFNGTSRAVQDSMMLYICLSESLTTDARTKLVVYKDQYTIDRKPSGPLFLKVIIRETYIDTNATVKFVRERLSSLDEYMKHVDSDIDKFNRYVQSQMLTLNAHGHTTEDLLANLFKGYAETSDRSFVQYIAKKVDDYEEGIVIGPNKLMQLALNKYNTLKEAGKWNAPTEEQNKIVALEAEVNKMKNDKRPHKKKFVAKNKGHKKSDSYKGPPEWMKTKPKDGETHSKNVGGKEYHWCPNHEAWTRHTPDECMGKGYKFPKQSNDSNDSEKKRHGNKNSNKGNNKKNSERTNSKQQKKVKMVQAYTSIIDSDNMDTDEE